MLGNKVTLHRSDDSGTTYGTKIADIMNIEAAERTSEVIESTQVGADHDYKEYDYGLKDAGEYNITTRYSAAQTEIEALVDAFENSTKEYLQLQFPAPISKTHSFRAIISKVGVAHPKEGKVERMFTIKVDGELTEAVLA